MKEWELASYRNYRWIVRDPDLLGGKLAIRDTRLSVSFLLACLAESMTAEEIADTYGPFPPETITDVLQLAAELVDSSRTPP
jgi:uncharacterized protein (DUF433 family)